MPSILDYFENPQFLNSVVSGGGGSFDQQQPPAPPPPPPQIMAQAPMGMNPEQFNNRFTGAGPETPPPGPAPGPINGPVGGPMGGPPPMPPMPPGQKFEGGMFGGMGFEPDGWKDMAPNGPMPATPGPMFGPPPGAPPPSADEPPPGRALGFSPEKTRDGFSYTDPPGLNLKTRPEDLAVNRTPRNGMSLDDMQLARPTPAGNPMDIRQADPRIARARQFGNFLQGLGKGLSAPTRPGAGKGAAFIAGAGGALQGYGEHEDKNLARDERGLDRGEKRREADQTHDYHNRTLDANKDYHNKLLDQHALDRGERTSRADADRDERSALARNLRPTGKETADGQTIYYDQTTGKEVVGENKGTRPTAAAGTREAVYQQKRHAYLEAYPGDTKGALDYANGIKKLDANDVTKMATAHAEREARELANREPTRFGKKENQAERDAFISQRVKYWRSHYDLEQRGAQPQVPGAPPAQPPIKNMGSDASRSPPAPPALTPPGQPPVNTPNAPAAPPVPRPPSGVPTRPAHIPFGSVYSPSLGVYMTPDGQRIPQ